MDVIDSRLDRFYEFLSSSDALITTRREELMALFMEIALKWDKVEDVDFDKVNTSIMVELIPYVKEFSELYIDNDSGYVKIMSSLLLSPRIITSKKRLL